MKDRLYRNFVRQWDEVTRVPPQTFGPLTPVYKKLAARFKNQPWLAFFLMSAITITAVYILIGPAMVVIVSKLQRGI